MTLKRTTDIFMSNFGMIFKMLAYFFVIFGVVIAGFVVVYIPMIKPIIEEILATGIWDNFRMALKQFVTIEDDYLATVEIIKQNFAQIEVIISSKMATLILTYIIFALIFSIGRFFLGLAYYTCSDVYNRFMNSAMNDNFTTNLTRNIYYSSRYSLASILILVPIETAAVYGFYKLFFALLKVFYIFTPAIMLGVIFLFWTIKFVFIGMWLPIMIEEKVSAFRAFGRSVKMGVQNFARMFRRYFAIIMLSYVIIVLSVITTWGFGIIIALPSVLAYMRIVELVGYYDIKNKKYYLNKEQTYISSLEN